ncbi:MAG: DUF1275 family protein [Solirubrobacteraceae bacterium]
MLSIVGEAERALRAPAEHRDGPLVALLLLLTFLAGLVDAVSYVRLGHVFLANMTGNVVFLSFAIAGASGLSSVSSLLAWGPSWPARWCSAAATSLVLLARTDAPWMHG